MSKAVFEAIDNAQLANATGGASPFLRQLWAAGQAKQWNRIYGNTSERALLQGVRRNSINALAVQHADHLTGRSQFPAAQVPYVTVGRGAVR